MSEPLLSIGGIQFQDYEQPDSLPLGGIQATAVFKFAGGNKNIQTLGGFEDPINLKGTFWYEGALSHAQQLDQFRIQGSEVLLQWANITRYVVITKFHYTVYNAEWVDYDMDLEPSRSSNELIATAASPVNSTPPAIQTDSATQTPVVNSNGATTIPSTTQQATKYQVVSGDTLWGIAYKFYKDGSKYTLIAQANSLPNPNEIDVGQILTIPQ